MKNIVEEMKELYLKEKKPWIVSFSAGKDSSLCLEYTFQMLISLPKEERVQPVYVLMVNTLAETPMMSLFMEKSMRKIQEAASRLGLPIIAEIAVPDMEDRFFFNTLGRGLLVITPKKRGRWCSHRMKQKPVQEKIRNIILSSSKEDEVEFSFSKDGQLSLLEQDKSKVIQILGTRLDESAARAASIRSHEIRDTKFSRHSYFANDILCYMPIKYMTNDEVFLNMPERFSWGIDSVELEVQYGKGFFLECGLQDTGEEKKACGMGSRQGCWTCPAMGNNPDKMLEGLIMEGHTELAQLYEWKRQLIEMRNDVRYREFERRQWRKQHQKRLAAAKHQRKQIHLFGDYFDKGLDVSDYFEVKKQTAYEQFDRAEDFEYLPGGLSVEGRRLMLEKLLFIQQETGFALISEEEVKAIVDYWNEEGYSISRDEVFPSNPPLDGSLVLKKDGTVNQLETTTSTPFFEILIDFENGRDEMVEYIESRKKATGQSYYYFTTHFDMGKVEQEVWNQAIFIVCRPGVYTEKEARKLIEGWLFQKIEIKEDHSFISYVRRTLRKAELAIKNGEKPYQEMVSLNKALDWIKEDDSRLSEEIIKLLAAL
ncbi:hypothetical protein [Cytobacillus oceanisediminis]|uniref:hypothetical protein n=1 Tax=Cytobacillus oceanisediminis TaxID=665099 RepID=UPI00203F7C4C|nr:hypothetical protein [Cytobacillus oceanisediminis]MCM3402976.1 hypothetical protein [Cytobacillus oceanisediminis]